MRKAPRLSAPSRSLTARSFTITNSQFWALLPVGALSASSIRRSTSASSTGSGFRRRIARCVRIASSSGIAKAGAVAAGAELLRLGHGRLPQRLPRGRRRAVRRRAGRRLREDARRRLRAPQPEPPRARLRRAGAARLRALREPLLRDLRRLEEDARRGGGQEPQERHEEPE